MEVWLALALGFLAGLSVGALRARRQRRATTGASVGFARLWPDKLPSRSATDILAGRVRVLLGGKVYDLPVLPRAASRRWLEGLDARFAALGGELEAAGNDTPRILTLLSTQTEALYELLRSYDQSNVLPPREEIDEVASDTQILRAVLEVWRAANPLAAALAERSEPSTSGTSPEPPITSRPPTDGAPITSMPT